MTVFAVGQFILSLCKKGYSLLSEISSDDMHRTPCMQDSRTWAPIEPKLFPLMSSSNPTVLSLQAKPSKRCLRASSGSLQQEMFKYLSERVAVKNCLKLGGISLVFLLENELRATFKWTRLVAHPLNRAPNNCKKKLSSFSDRHKHEE